MAVSEGLHNGENSFLREKTGGQMSLRPYTLSDIRRRTRDDDRVWAYILHGDPYFWEWPQEADKWGRYPGFWKALDKREKAWLHKHRHDLPFFKKRREEFWFDRWLLKDKSPLWKPSYAQ